MVLQTAVTKDLLLKKLETAISDRLMSMDEQPTKSILTTSDKLYPSILTLVISP